MRWKVDLYLVLSNGKIFKGKAFGHVGNACGTVTFTTSMSGYTEAMSDPTLKGKIIVQAFPMCGNYGVNLSDMESDKLYPSVYISKEFCETPSNFRCEMTVEELMKKHKVIGLSQIDTRALVRIIRNEGEMLGIVTDSLENIDFEELKKQKIDFNISTSENYIFNEKGAFKVAVIDFGLKKSVLSCLQERGAALSVLNPKTAISEIEKGEYHGVVLSDGCTELLSNENYIDIAKKIVKMNVPSLGLGLGCLYLAKAFNLELTKLKTGHRGENQPVRCEGNRIFITSQSHSYTVDSASVESIANPYMINVNDGTVEGLKFLNSNAFGTLFKPEGAGGPHDGRFVFDDFLDMTKRCTNAVK